MISKNIIIGQTLKAIGRIFVLVGIALTIAKWFFNVTEIDNWALLFLLPCVVLTFVGGRTSKSKIDR